MAFLVIIRYSDEAEKKRVDYILEKWREKVKVVKPEGLVFFLDGGEVREVIEELLSRVAEDKISFYSLEPQEIGISREERKIQVKVKGERKSVGRLVNFLLARYKGVLKSETPQERIYELRTRRGQAEVLVNFNENADWVDLRIKIAGYGEVVDFLFEKLEEEFKYLKEA